jgi:outer membrane protein insertion porin family
MLKRVSVCAAVLACALAIPALAAAQAPAQPAAPAPSAPLPSVTVCGQPYAPAAEPPAGSGPVLLTVAPCFEAQGGVPLVDIQTYVYYMQIVPKASKPSQGQWTPYDDSLEQIMRDDFRRLMSRDFLDNLSIETTDYPFPNGTIGKIVVYNMEERQRVKIVDYVGSKKIETSKIDDKLKEQKIELRLDTFLDQGTINKVKGVVRDMLVEKGFQNAEVTTEIQPMPGSPKLVHLTFHMSEGPEVKIRDIVFVGNKAISGGALKHHMKENKEHGWLSFLSGHGTFDQTKFDQDAEMVTDYYRQEGYIQAVVGAPEVKVLEDERDAKTRWIELRIPVQEGRRYTIGEFKFDGNTVVKTELLRPLFDIKTGDFYDQNKIRKGYQKTQEMYGAGGYWEFTAYPDNVPRDQPDPAAAAVPAALAPAPAGPPVVDVTFKILEGKQYFVNRIIFTGNTTTRDNVVRREMRLLEDGVFNTEALKFSIRRLNQLGYFKPLDQQKPGDVTVDKLPGDQARVDVKLKLEEQNRNQLQFGAGVSQFEGFFGQLSFQTSNFLGRGESLTLSAQGGTQAKNYSVAFTEPFLFDRNITGSANVFRSDVRYIGQFTQQTTGATLSMGFPIGRGFTRMFTSYSYERVRVTDIADYYTANAQALESNPFLADTLLIGENGQRIISRVTPSIVYNSVDQPIFPNTGKRLTASIDLAGIGGNTNFYKPLLESIWYLKQNSRMSLGIRGQFQYIHNFTGPENLPIFERLSMGGEYTVRGYDFRTIGPQDPITGLVLGGNKSLLLNVEQNFNIASAVRLILFYDAGQVRDVGDAFSWKEPAIERIIPTPPILFDPLASQILTDPNALNATTFRTNGLQTAFKTSTGAEVRFFMPVLNVPFRLIFAYNPQRAGVLNNNFLPQGAFAFRFAVGTTF